MQHNISKLIFVTGLVAIMSGCSNYVVRTSGPNTTFCTLAGGLLGGGAGALASAGPATVVGVMAGATLGNYICSTGEKPVPQPVAVIAPKPQETPVTVVREMDSDSDGVMDGMDRCPNTPAGSKVNANGCPSVLMVLTGVNFAFDSSVIDPKSEVILNKGVAALNDAKSVNIHIEGHTDSRGTEAYNQNLSEKRATAVLDYFVRKGIVSARLKSGGEGETHPVALNTTDDGRYENRRVELHVD